MRVISEIQLNRKYTDRFVKCCALTVRFKMLIPIYIYFAQLPVLVTPVRVKYREIAVRIEIAAYIGLCSQSHRM